MVLIGEFKSDTDESSALSGGYVTPGLLTSYGGTGDERATGLTEDLDPSIKIKVVNVDGQTGELEALAYYEHAVHSNHYVMSLPT